jgi:hypothetical protein
VAALALALAPARPTVLETVSAVGGVVLLGLARGAWARELEARVGAVLADASAGLAVALVIALERAVGQ